MATKPFSPHRYLVAAARRVWRWDTAKKLVATQCAIGSTRRICAGCKQGFPKKEVHIDHIEPVGKQPREWDDYPNFYRRLFCPASNLQGLCKSCHKAKTAKEAKERHK